MTTNLLYTCTLAYIGITVDYFLVAMREIGVRFKHKINAYIQSSHTEERKRKGKKKKTEKKESDGCDIAEGGACVNECICHTCASSASSSSLSLCRLAAFAKARAASIVHSDKSHSQAQSHSRASKSKSTSRLKHGAHLTVEELTARLTSTALYTGSQRTKHVRIFVLALSCV